MKALGRAALVGALAMAMVGLGYPWDAHVAHAFSDVPVVTCVSFDTTPGCATTMTVDEGQWFTINVTFTDLDPTGEVDTTGVHFILIKLGSGLPETTPSIPPGSADANGVTSFSIAKRYLDNRPTADLTVKVGDDFPTFNTSATFHVAVTVNNVARTASLASGGGGPVNEGGAVSVSFSGAIDPSPTDTTAGFHYSFACDGQDSSLAASSLAAGTASSTSCAFNDSGSITVKGRIFDKNDGSAPYPLTVTVNNVAPTATISNSGPVTEGSLGTISLSGPFDPSSADTTAGFHYAFDCSGGSLDAATYASSGTSPSANCTYDDGPSSPTASARILDKDGGFTDYTTTVTVNNAAPTATFKGPSVNEGSPIALSLTAAFDPSTADTTAGFQYAFDCGDGSGYGAFGSLNTASCATTDSGSRTVRGKLQDKNGGSTEYTATVTVTNVAPTATFNAPASVNEGSSAAPPLGAPPDPSSADTAAGLQYAFDCGDGSGYGALGSSNTASCATTDSGTRVVRGKISDKDGGSSDYAGTVMVNNVAPTATFNAPVSVNAGSPIALSLTAASDPSSADTAAGFQYAFDCGDGSGYGALGSSNTSSCATSTSGTRTVRGKISDKDGGSSEYTATVTGISVAPDADKLVDELGTLLDSWKAEAMSGKVDQARSQFASGDKDSCCSSLKT